jgi:hypothetical protein
VDAVAIPKSHKTNKTTKIVQSIFTPYSITADLNSRLVHWKPTYGLVNLVPASPHLR